MPGHSSRIRRIRSAWTSLKPAPKEAAMITASSTQMTILGFLSAMFSICNIMQYQLQEITITIPSPYQDQEVLMSANWILLTTWTHHCFPTNWMLQQCANHSKHIQGAVGSVVGAWSLSKELAADLTGIMWKLVWTFVNKSSLKWTGGTGGITQIGGFGMFRWSRLRK